MRRAYNHAKWLDERSRHDEMVADYLDELRQGNYIEPLAYASQNKPVFEMKAAA